MIHISRIFIERPIMTALVTTWVCMMGVFGYWNLPISALPNIEFPVIVVQAELPGANAKTMAEAIALPLEQRFSSIPGVDTMTSTNAQGISQIVLQFNLDVNIDAAAQDVGSAIGNAQAEFPPEMTTLPTYRKVNPAEQPVIYLSVNSDTLPLWQVNQYAEDYIAARLSMLPNVAQVDVQGQQAYAVRVYAKPSILKARGLDLVSISNRLAGANVNAPSGVFQGPIQLIAINPNAQLKNAAEFGDVMIRAHDGLRLKDIAEVKDSVANLYNAAWYNGAPSILLAISRQPGANTLEVAEQIKKVLPEIKRELPASVKLELILDRSEPIKTSVNEVKMTGIITLCLVILVIFVFLRSFKATLIPSISIPVSLIITFGIIYALGFSLNNLTLLGLTLAMGLIVDDAIVVLENIVRHQEQGASPLEAALKGSQEIGLTVLSMTLSLVAVFVPVVFMSGIVGRLFYEFAVTITVVIVISGIISLTLTPMMTRKFKSAANEPQENKFYEFLRKKFENLEVLYKKSLLYVLRYQKVILVTTIFVLGLNIVLYIIIPKGFFPTEDTGLVYGIVDTIPETSFDSMKKASTEFMEILSHDPDVAAYNASIGSSSASNTSNQGRFFIKLKPFSQRTKSVDEILDRLRQKFLKNPAFKVSLQLIQNLRIGAMLSKGQYLYTLKSQNFDNLIKYVPLLENKLRQTPGFLDVSTDLQGESLQLNLKIDRDHAAKLGLEAQDISKTINLAYGDQQVSTIYTDLDIYPVILSLDKSQSRELHDLEDVYILNNSNQLLPLMSVVSSERVNAPLVVNHLNRFPAASLSFNLAPGTSLGQAIEKIQETQVSLNFPGSITATFEGAAAAFNESQGGQIGLIIAAIITIYIILGILYESYYHPLTILAGLPSAGLGALLCLLLFGYELNVMSLIGIILLIGIVKKNAIMMIDYAVERQRDGNLAAYDAIVEACLRRFRPIMMTTAAAIMGAIPIAFWMGEGSELRRPLGICILGGLLFSQCLTLYITPVFYLYMERFKTRFSIGSE
jgi:HAE1 family hydrophobic/amphiphilic exporter-1